MLNALLGMLFGHQPADMLSGYRVFSRRFVKSFPAQSRRFEIETETTVHALEMRVPMAEVPTRYLARPVGSSSKLHTYRDGARIVVAMALLFRDVKPLLFFCWLAAMLAAVGLSFGVGVVMEFMHTGLVRRLPTAVLATGLVLLAALSLAAGVILGSVAAQARSEAACLPRDAADRAAARAGGAVDATPEGDQLEHRGAVGLTVRPHERRIPGQPGLPFVAAKGAVAVDQRDGDVAPSQSSRRPSSGVPSDVEGPPRA